MGKKLQFASDADLMQTRAECLKEAEKAKDAGEKAANEVRDELIRELGKVSAVVTQNAQTSKDQLAKTEQTLKDYIKSVAKSVRDELLAKIPELEDKIEACKSYVMSYVDRRSLEVSESSAALLMEQVSGVVGDLAKKEADLTDHSNKLFSEAAEEMLKQREFMLGELARVGDDLRERSSGNQETNDQQFRAVGESQDKLRDELTARSDNAERKLWEKLGLLDSLVDQNREDSKLHAEDVDDRATAGIRDLRHDAECRLDGLDLSVTKLHDAVAEVENLPTRRVDWVIKNVSKRIRPPSASKACLHTSWFSPKFDMAGAHGLQLELQFFKKSDPPVEGENVGDCAAFLWACKGMSLVYKLYIGTKFQVCEKVFNGRVPYGTKRLCFLRDHINREEDSLRVSIEILEAVREVEHQIKAAPPLPEGEEEDERNKPLEGRIVFRRHVTHRLMDQVNKQAENMRSRLVRKVEWQLENASQLRKCFPPGEPMCSVSFAAAAIENMQLLFYPCGYQGATDGFCSLFLYAPAGATMKYTLLTGNQKRDATHFFEDTGAFGRTNFCRFESIVDEESDTILICLDIHEAHQDVTARIAHPITQPGDRRSLPQIEGAVPNAVESVVKMHRASSRPSACLEEKRVLPSLWTATSLAEKGGDDPNLMRSFDDLKSMSRSTQSRKQFASTSPAQLSSAGGAAAQLCGSPLGNTSRSLSTPALARGGAERPQPSADVVLPNLSRSGESFHPHGAAASPKRHPAGARGVKKQPFAAHGALQTEAALH